MIRKSVTLVATLAAAAVLHAQQAAPPPAAQPLPPLAGVHYRYWPLQIVQWIGSELPYSMILVDVDKRGPQPIYDAELFDRAGKLTHYTNSPEQLALDKRLGAPAFQVPMQLDGPDEPAKGAQYLLRFNTETGTPVSWQFIEGTDESDQGSGLSPIDIPIPILMYREQGALAGEGSAVKIGNTVSTADVWQEFAHPPYFIPYHGAISTGIHILTFVPDNATWKLDGSTLKTEDGVTLAMTHETGKGGTQSTTFTNDAYDLSISLDHEANGAISRAWFGPKGAKPEHTVSIAFTPAAAAGVQSKFDVIAGKKTKLASGTVETGSGPDNSVTESWSFATPDSVKGKTAKAATRLQQ